MITLPQTDAGKAYNKFRQAVSPSNVLGETATNFRESAKGLLSAESKIVVILEINIKISLYQAKTYSASQLKYSIG